MRLLKKTLFDNKKNALYLKTAYSIVKVAKEKHKPMVKYVTRVLLFGTY